MDTIWLEDLVALAECLNFSRAAERRNITQPAYSRRIKALEEWVGTPLVDRATHRLELTTAGDVMLETARDVLMRIEKGRSDVDQAMAAVASLRFASTHALSFTFFPDWFRSLGPSAASVPVHLLSDNMNACERMMAEGRAQFLLCHHHPQTEIRLENADFKYIELASDKLVPVSRRGSDGAALHAFPGSADHPVPLLAFDDRSGMGRILNAAIRGQDKLFTKAVFTSHLAVVLKTLAKDGKGVAWTPLSLAEDELGPEGMLTLAGGPEWLIPVSIILMRPRLRQSDLAETFWALAEKQIRKDR